MKLLEIDYQKILPSALPYIFVFLVSIFRPYDTDLGWHLKYGQYFFQNWTILRTNIYSTDMAGYIWPNTNWLTDVITFAVFNLGGFFGLSLAAALIITLTFWVFSKAYDLSFFEQAFIFPVIAALEGPVNEVSFRGQLISILFIAVLLFLLKEISLRRQLFLIPLLFMVWVNTHGQFIMGFAILGLSTLVKIIEPAFDDFNKFKIKSLFKLISDNKKYLWLFGLSILAGLLNPFGLQTYRIALSHLYSSELKYIMEYLPIEDLTDEWWKQMIFGIMVFFGSLAFFFNGKIKKQLFEIALVGIIYPLSWLVRRYAWSLYYLGIPLLKPVANFLKPDSEKNTFRTATIFFVAYIIFTVYLKQPFSQYLDMDWEIYCTQFNNCSAKSVEYVRDNKLTGNLLTLYGWGGYMIWNYPDVKPSIDGRMTVWKDDSGRSVLAQYYGFEQNWKDIDKSKYDVVLMWNGKPLYGHLLKLVEQGKWEKRYEDENAGVFVRIKEASKSSEFILKN